MRVAADPNSSANSTSKSSKVVSLDSEAGILNLTPATSFHVSNPGTVSAETLADSY